MKRRGIGGPRGYINNDSPVREVRAKNNLRQACLSHNSRFPNSLDVRAGASSELLGYVPRSTTWTGNEVILAHLLIADEWTGFSAAVVAILVEVKSRTISRILTAPCLGVRPRLDRYGRSWGRNINQLLRCRVGFVIFRLRSHAIKDEYSGESFRSDRLLPSAKEIGRA